MYIIAVLISNENRVNILTIIGSVSARELVLTLHFSVQQLSKGKYM